MVKIKDIEENVINDNAGGTKEVVGHDIVKQINFFPISVLTNIDK